MAVSDFFDLEPYIIADLLRTAKERDEYNHRLMYIAMTNAVGGMLSNKYKYLDVFDEKQQPKEYSEEEANDLRNELLNAFK